MNPASTLMASALASLLALTACTSIKRPTYARAELEAQREAEEKAFVEYGRERFAALMAGVKSQQDDFAAGRLPAPPTVDVLIISGGGDWGAFGAGFLKGWGKLPQDHELARPQFDVVTGVSTGALIAPFAFIGTDESIEKIVQLYRNPKEDWVQTRGEFFFTPDNPSLLTVPGLERDLKRNVTVDSASQIAQAGMDGRILAVNTTNLDTGTSRVFFLDPVAKRAIATGNLDPLHNILLASSAIPGVFPYREIDGHMYVDGGVSGNIIYGGRYGEPLSPAAIWQGLYPDAPKPKFRYWVIFNNQFRMTPEVIKARWPSIAGRSISVSTQSSTLTAIRHLYTAAELSSLKRGAEIEVRSVAIPSDWVPIVPGPFEKATMNQLADLGEKMGADPASWQTTPP